jgi:hypothetical protein
VEKLVDCKGAAMEKWVSQWRSELRKSEWRSWPDIKSANGGEIRISTVENY